MSHVAENQPLTESPDLHGIVDGLFDQVQGRVGQFDRDPRRHMSDELILSFEEDSKLKGRDRHAGALSLKICDAQSAEELFRRLSVSEIFPHPQYTEWMYSSTGTIQHDKQWTVRHDDANDAVIRIERDGDGLDRISSVGISIGLLVCNNATPLAERHDTLVKFQQKSTEEHPTIARKHAASVQAGDQSNGITVYPLVRDIEHTTVHDVGNEVIACLGGALSVLKDLRPRVQPAREVAKIVDDYQLMLDVIDGIGYDEWSEDFNERVDAKIASLQQ